MKNPLLLSALLLALSGCAEPIVMQNPANGQVAQCYAPVGVVRSYYERDKCVEQYEKLGWQKTDAR